jgi:hypothetical protein
MEVLMKEFTKYSKPMFFNFARILIYIIGLIILLGVYSRIDDSKFIFYNFFILIFISLVFVILDVLVARKKMKTYKSHKVQFFNDYILFVDHRGSFQLPYKEMDSYQITSNQILIRIQKNRFLISSKQHGINFEELRLMADFLVGKNVESKIGRGFIYFVIVFLVINYGLDYLFIQVFKLSSDASLFGTLYFCLVIGMVYYIWEQINVKKLIYEER